VSNRSFGGGTIAAHSAVGKMRPNTAYRFGLVTP
jgi:hypothetical protein